MYGWNIIYGQEGFINLLSHPTHCLKNSQDSEDELQCVEETIFELCTATLQETIPADLKSTQNCRILSLHFDGPSVQEMNGFNLVVGDVLANDVAYTSNRGQCLSGPVKLAPGLYGLSNDNLDQWPKVQTGKKKLMVRACL